MNERRDYIIKLMQELKKEFDIQHQHLHVNPNYDGFGMMHDAQFKYQLEYDQSFINITLSKFRNHQQTLQALAHEFAHFLTKEVILMNQILFQKSKHDKILYKLGRRYAQKTAKRLTSVVLQKLRAIDIRLGGLK